MATRRITNNPIPEDIEPSGLEVGISRVETLPSTAVTSTSLSRPNGLNHADDGSNRVYTNDTRGPIWLIENGMIDPDPILDLREARGDNFVRSGSEQGLRSFAFHPDFDRPGTDGYGKLYTMSTETVASADPDTPLFETDPGRRPVQHSVVAEWEMDPENPTEVDVDSRREVLRIEEPFGNHNGAQLLFNPNAKPGDALYGSMYISTGDGGWLGTSPGQPAGPDPYGQGQDLQSASGKILRIDPLEQHNGGSYGIPTQNPFVNDPDALPEIYAYGFRHPQNLSFDTGGDNKFLISDIGQRFIEEINLAVKGGNFGWKEREGTFVLNDDDQDSVSPLPANDDELGYTYPVAQYDHDEGFAVTGGFVYRGDKIPELQGQYVFGDIANGRIFHVPVDQLELGAQADIQELTLVANDENVSMRDLVGSRVDLRFGQDEEGDLYVMSKQDGNVRKLTPDEGRTVNVTGEDRVVGTVENDRLFGNGDDNYIRGYDGDDYVRSGGGADRIAGGTGEDRLLGDADNDSIRGATGDDSLYGGTGNDSLYGENGKDGLSGSAGNDRLEGGDNQDVVFGGGGNDVLLGEAGSDRLKGAGGNDLLAGGTGYDVLTGGDGNDRFLWTETSANIKTIEDFEAGEDHLQLSSAVGPDGETIESFGDLETSVVDGDLNIEFEWGSFVLEDVRSITSDDVIIY